MSLSDYLIAKGKILGEGSFGKIYMGKIKKTNEIVAIKKIDVSSVDEEEYKNEANILKYLSGKDCHPLILCYIDSFEENNYFYIITEYVRGYTLEKLISMKEKITEENAFKLLKFILEGISYIHSKNVAHRDIKPENIFFNETSLKIIDFGLSCRIGENTKQCKELQIGTQAYFSPEMIMNSPDFETNKGELLKACDIWALGISMFELLNFHLPFAGESSEVFYRNVLFYNKEISTYPSEKMNKIIDLMMTWNYKERPTANQLLEML